MRTTRQWLLASAIAGLLLTSVAAAHDRDRRRDVAYRYGFDAGYHDGFDHARFNSHRRGDFSFRNHDYRSADRGYQRWMGSKGQYKKGYREGYEAGYRDALHRRGWRPGIRYQFNWGYRPL